MRAERKSKAKKEQKIYFLESYVGFKGTSNNQLSRTLF